MVDASLGRPLGQNPFRRALLSHSTDKKTESQRGVRHQTKGCLRPKTLLLTTTRQTNKEKRGAFCGGCKEDQGGNKSIVHPPTEMSVGDRKGPFKASGHGQLCVTKACWKSAPDRKPNGEARGLRGESQSLNQN